MHWYVRVSVGSVTTLPLAEIKESERMDTSSKQQRTYEESKREWEETWEKQRGGDWKLEKSETGNRKVKSLKKGRRKRTRKKSKGGGKEKRQRCLHNLQDVKQCF